MNVEIKDKPKIVDKKVTCKNWRKIRKQALKSYKKVWKVIDRKRQLQARNRNYFNGAI